MDLNAPPLVPIAVLALASSGQVGPAGEAGGGRAAPARAPAAAYSGATVQERPVSMRVRGRRASWRIAYAARCDDGTVVRGRYVSGGGTPMLELDPGGRFELSASEPAEFEPEGTGSARFSIGGRLGARDGSGTWRLTLVTPPGAGGRVACTAGPLGWRVTRG